MATYQELVTKFQSDYGINFDLDRLVTDSRRFNYVEDVLLETNSGNEAGVYKSVLRELLRSYMENKVGIASGKTDYDASNFDLVKFVKDLCSFGLLNVAVCNWFIHCINQRRSKPELT